MSESIAPRITVVTLGVSNLERSVAFYRDGLGWASEGIIGTEFPDGAVAFFTLAGGLRLAGGRNSGITFSANSRRLRIALSWP